MKKTATKRERLRNRSIRDRHIPADELLAIYAGLLRRRHPICKSMADAVDEIIERFSVERRSEK